MAFVGGLAAGGASAIGTVLSAVGTAVGVMSSIAQAKYQQQIAENNAIIAKNNADIAAEKTQSQQQINDQQSRALMGQQEVAQAASGLSGKSQLNVRKSTQKIARQDSFNIRQAGAYEIQNFLQQSTNFSAEAVNAGKQGTMNALAGLVSIGSTLIGGAQATKSSLNKINEPLGGNSARY